MKCCSALALPKEGVDDDNDISLMMRLALWAGLLYNTLDEASDMFGRMRLRYLD